MHLWFLPDAILHSSLHWTRDWFTIPFVVIVSISHRNPFRCLLCYVIRNLCLKIRFVQVAFANPHSQPPKPWKIPIEISLNYPSLDAFGHRLSQFL